MAKIPHLCHSVGLNKDRHTNSHKHTLLCDCSTSCTCGKTTKEDREVGKDQSVNLLKFLLARWSSIKCHTDTCKSMLLSTQPRQPIHTHCCLQYTAGPLPYNKNISLCAAINEFYTGQVCKIQAKSQKIPYQECNIFMFSLGPLNPTLSLAFPPYLYIYNRDQLQFLRKGREVSTFRAHSPT